MEKVKKCTKCKLEKPLNCFSMHPKMLDGKQSQCIECCNERARLKRQGAPCISCGKPKEYGVPKGARLCKSCSETCFECKERPRKKQHRLCAVCQAKRDKIRKNTPEAKLKTRISKIVSVYKVSREFAEKLALTKNCAACGRDVSGQNSHVDHCHDTGKVRGVLCFNCNAALGHLRDDEQRLQMLISYLKKSKDLL